MKINSVLVVTGDNALFASVQGVLRRIKEPGPVLPVGAVPVHFTAVGPARRELADQQNVPDLIILDSKIVFDARYQLDGSVDAALDFINWLRMKDVRTTQNKAVPVLVLQSERVARMEEACTVESRALALSQRWLEQGEPSVLDPSLTGDIIAILLKNTNEDSAAFPKAVTIDIEFRQSKLRYWVRLKDEKGAARRQLWVEEVVPPKELIRIGKYQFWPARAPGMPAAEPPKGWQNAWIHAGDELFRFFFRGLGTELLEHLSAAVGGLQNMHFRLIVDNEMFYPVPFEAMYDDLVHGGHIAVQAPVARRIQAIHERVPEQTDGAAAPYRILFIAAQLTRSVGTFQVAQPWDQATVARYLEFKPLGNIVRELCSLRSAVRGVTPRPQLTIFGSRRARMRGKFGAELKELLSHSKFDIVHFAGHSHEEADARTYLVLPGRDDAAEVLPIELFADWVGRAGVGLVYLSSCHGASRRAHLRLVRHGVEHCLGFRWNVIDGEAADFARHFYRELFARPDSPYCVAFREAIKELHAKQIESPIWAAPILVAQPEDWAERGLARRRG